MPTPIENYHARRAEALASMGGRCARCGSTEDLHIVKRPDVTEKFTVSNVWSRTAEIRNHLYSLCEALCGEHAKAQMWNKGHLKHGAYWAAYKKKCSCEICEVYRKENSAKRREERKVKREAAGLPLRVRKPKPPKAPKTPKIRAPKPYTPKPQPVQIQRPFNVVTDLHYMNGRKFPSVEVLKSSLRKALGKHMGGLPPAGAQDQLYGILEQKGWLEYSGRTCYLRLPALRNERQQRQEYRANERAADADLLAASEVNHEACGY